MDKISIIVPIYNAEKYLDECIQSIINQTYKNLEILCINDGSKDSSLEILNKYAKEDKRVIVITKENGGYASAINLGLEKATGEFIGIVESDDVCHVEMYELLYNQIKKTDADFAVCDFYYFNNNKSYKPKSTKPITLDEYECFNLISSPSIMFNPSYPWKNLYKTNFLTQNNIKMKADGMGAYEDIPWNADILSKANKITFVDKNLYYYRTDNENSSTNNGKIGLINYNRRRKQSRETLLSNNKFFGDIKEYWYAQAHMGSKHFYNLISKQFKPEYYKHMKELMSLAKADGITFKYFSKGQKKEYDRIQRLTYKQYIIYNKLRKILSKILSVKNDRDNRHKCITLLGFKIKLKRSK